MESGSSTLPMTDAETAVSGMKLEDVLLRSTYNRAQVVNRVAGMEASI